MGYMLEFLGGMANAYFMNLIIACSKMPACLVQENDFKFAFACEKNMPSSVEIAQTYKENMVICQINS